MDVRANIKISLFEAPNGEPIALPKGKTTRLSGFIVLPENLAAVPAPQIELGLVADETLGAVSVSVATKVIDLSADLYSQGALVPDAIQDLSAPVTPGAAVKVVFTGGDLSNVANGKALRVEIIRYGGVGRSDHEAGAQLIAAYLSVLVVDQEVTDHGALSGLGDDDHLQYHTDGRALTWLGTRSIADLGTKTHSLLDSLTADDHPQYLLLAGKSGGQSVSNADAFSIPNIITIKNNAGKRLLEFGVTGPSQQRGLINIYGADDGAGNYERLNISHSGDASGIQCVMEKGGTGIIRNFTINAPSILLSANNSIQIGGAIVLGIAAATMRFQGGFGGATLGTSVQFSSNTPNAGPFTGTSGEQNILKAGDAGNESWRPSSGNASYNLLKLIAQINTSGSYSGIVRGLYYSPVLTSLTGVSHRAIEIEAGDSLLGSISGNVIIGTTALPGGGSGCIVLGNGTALSSMAANTCGLYAADVVAGNSAPHFLTEGGDLIKLYKVNTYTQTYATADRTLSAYTADDESTVYTGIDNAQAGTPYAQLTDLNALRVAYENLRAFVEDIAGMVNAGVDDLQSIGVFG